MKLDLCVVSGLVRRWVASRLSEAASRYCLSASDLVGALADSLATTLSEVEEIVRYYGCDRNAWRAALTTLISAGSSLYEFLKPVIKGLKGEGLLVVSNMSWLDNFEGVVVRLLSLDPWLDSIDVEVGKGRVKAVYSFILGNENTIPDYDEVIDSVKGKVVGGAGIDTSSGEARLVYVREASDPDELVDIESVSALFSKILRDAGVEWLVAEVEHGYSPKEHYEIARKYFELGLRVESLPEKTVDYLRALEELVKMLVKKHGLEDLIREAQGGGWTAMLLDEAVERLNGLYPHLKPAWEKSLEASLELQESRITRDTITNLERYIKKLLETLG
ncbi:hypothetical protein Pyrfu_0063 [Pyrolobus fumarii 1A]|uniref:Uncharacterized protein n=1 Tax=Pyrolobus fumarii (strain DSM 11204 / 1A) TaxID=694429 RepID=G0EE19_PYRF1|nr:hypothetical protein [Pyrolobus fumarii]AEM37935.1 hypothetical protein Pyrfu_0063 [Pyrolobus fumarii 1A]